MSALLPAGCKIRGLVREDVPALAGIEREIFSVPWSEQAFSDLLTRDYNLCLVAEADGCPVGCACLTMLGDEGDIDKVMVAEEFRRRGIAYAMLQSLMEEGRRRGVASYTLEVRAGNEPAIRLYEKLGFVSEGIRPKFYEKPVEDAVIMWYRQSLP